MSQENVDLVRRLCMRIGENNPDVPWLELCDEHIQITNVKQFPVADEYLGHEGVRQWVTDTFDVFSEIRHDIEELIETDEAGTVVTVLRTRGRMRHTGLDFDGLWATVWRIRAGKALEAHGYATRSEALEAVGLSE